MGFVIAFACIFLVLVFLVVVLSDDDPCSRNIPVEVS